MNMIKEKKENIVTRPTPVKIPQPDTDKLDRAVENVRKDAGIAPKQYLETSVVPKGGE